MEGTVRELYIFRERGQPGIPVESAVLRENAGMEGDCHASGGERQLTLLAGEIRDWMRSQTEPGLCFNRYKANIETAGLDAGELTPGMIITVGTSVLQVSKTSKECFPECRLYQSKEGCRLSSGGIFLKVIRTGKVLINDKIMIGGVLQ